MSDNEIKTLEFNLPSNEDPWRRAERILLGQDENVEHSAELEQVQQGFQERVTHAYETGFEDGVRWAGSTIENNEDPVGSELQTQEAQTGSKDYLEMLRNS